MATRESTRDVGHSDDWRQGAMLAVEMLKEFQSEDRLDSWAVNGNTRAKDAPQENLVARYLERCASPEAVVGFTAILTDILGTYANCGEPDADWQELLATMPWRDAMAEWDRRRAARKGGLRLVVDNTPEV